MTYDNWKTTEPEWMDFPADEEVDEMEGYWEKACDSARIERDQANERRFELAAQIGEIMCCVRSAHSALNENDIKHAKWCLEKALKLKE